MLVAGTVPWPLCVSRNNGEKWGGGWVGWGGDDNVPCTCTHLDATQLLFSLHTSRCYATLGVGMITFLALAVAGTQCIDRAWGVCKTFIPKQIKKR